MSSERPYAALRAHLLRHDIPFREIQHPPAASALEYHQVVGSRLAQQAKALLVRRYRDDGGKDYVIYALPGDAEADLDAVSAAASSVRLRLATRQELERQTGCRFGELPPVGSIFGCELILDERLIAEGELYFNAARLDRSFVVAPADLIALERPMIVDVQRRRLAWRPDASSPLSW
jgi:Ala-tRNA(Pro) deacylase